MVAERAGTRSTLRFLAIFGLITLGAFAVQVTPWVDTHAVTPLLSDLADLARGLIRLFGGAADSSDNVLSHPENGFAIRISNGCSGIEAVILLIAAMAAYPAPWRYRLLGWGLGVIAIMAVNMLRIISLFYIGQHAPAWFDWAHLYAWELLIMLDGVLVYLAWLRWMPSAQRRSIEAA